MKKMESMTKFLANILIGDGCWPWTGAKDSQGRGVLRVGERLNYRARRYSYEQFIGPIPPRSFLSNTCEDRSCVRPDHQQVSQGNDHSRDVSRLKKIRMRKVSPSKYKVRNLFTYAVQIGEVMRPSTCAMCGVPCVPQGHHPDYSRPYFVAWLCQPCHSEVHHRTRPISADHLAVESLFGGKQ